MTLGPNRLRPIHRRVIKNPKHKKAIKLYRRRKIGWSDKSLGDFRTELRASLRSQQNDRCYYCRQLVYQERRNACEDIEHYLDKSKLHYTKWAMSPVNLTMACHACNLQKNVRDLGDAAVRSAVALTAASGSFRWIHPYFDDYHQNIQIDPGWVYRVKANATRPAESAQMINDLELDRISRVQHTTQKYAALLERTSVLVGRCIDQNKMARARRLLEIQLQLIAELRWT